VTHNDATQRLEMHGLVGEEMNLRTFFGLVPLSGGIAPHEARDVLLIPSPTATMHILIAHSTLKP
jgi:hypothetical protein